MLTINTSYHQMHYHTSQNIRNYNQVAHAKSPTGNILLFLRRLNLIIWSQEFGGKSGLLERAEKRAAPFVNPCKWNGGGDRTKVRELAEQRGGKGGRQKGDMQGPLGQLDSYKNEITTALFVLQVGTLLKTVLQDQTKISLTS